ncbi:hypothetical protein OQ279_06920 [Salinimicrobium sp. MT39]|uniref:Uncharacterized protein n=1 Tax=Salinimicrobium profundisediminis TaxID=2994553 RepID=A0A9X3CW69_9FLAO|nr:hypothetical protein [Salinimicrobium profundisediminis]MCX2837883.1 hypothetical protein [Salinimicrobium profundisediminis]
MENSIKSILKKYKPRFVEVSDAYFYPNIPEKKLNKLIKNHTIEYGQKVYFHSVGSLLGFVHSSCVITDKYFSFKNSDLDEYFKMGWDKIQEVRYYGNKFDFVYSSSDPSRNFQFKKDDILPSLLSDSNLGNHFAALLTEIAKLFQNEDQDKFEKVKASLKEGDTKSFEQTSSEYLKCYGEDGDFSNNIHLLRAQYFFRENKFDNALEEVKCCEHHLEEGFITDDNLAIDVLKTKGDILLKSGQEYGAVTAYSGVLKNYSDYAQVNLFRAKVGAANLQLQKNFLKLNYSSRKLILVDNEQADLSSKEFKVILKDKLPALKFPVGHPISKELYVGHPYNADVYIPVSTFEENLFMDRFQEFSYFLQSLGATKISIVNKRGGELGEVGEISGRTGLKINTLVAESETTNEYSSKKELQSQNFKHISRTQTFSPVKKPFLPSNLVWYPHETSWQRLYEQRVNGNILNHSEIISTEQNQVITKNEKRSIQQSLEYYLVEAGASHSIDADHMFREKETTEWVINVEFAPIETLKEKGSDLTNTELTSQDIVQEKLNVREQMSDNLDSLTAEEIKYQSRVEILVDDNREILDEDRRILDRVRAKLNITEKRAIELEQQVLKKFVPAYSSEELQYLEEVKFCLEDDGEISDKERQLLELERDDLGILPDRALEIEKEIIQRLKEA